MIFYYIVVRIPLSYLLYYVGFGLNGIWVAVLVSHVVASIAACISGSVSSKNRQAESKGTSLALWSQFTFSTAVLKYISRPLFLYFSEE